MSVTLSPTYIKNGATFASGAEALADKNSLYSPTLTQQVNDCYAQMTVDGILLAPIDPVWDQATFTLSVNKLVSSAADYRNAVTFNEAECVAKAEEAGWTLVHGN